jgi:hypothetical protein
MYVKLLNFLYEKRDESREAGQTTVEFIVVVGIFILLAAPILYALFVAIKDKLDQVGAEIGG